MDGSSFIIDEQTRDPPSLEAAAAEVLSPAIVAGVRPSVDKGHWLSVGCAAFAHFALIVFMLGADSDAMGDGGVALETIAVSIVDVVPTVSAPEVKPVETGDVLPDAEQPAAEADPRQENQKPEQRQPEPSPKLALDLPPEPVLDPNTLAPPVRQPETKNEPRQVVQEQPSDKPAENSTEAAPAQAASVPVATGALPQFSSAEAAPGVVRAYARQISGVLDRNKPRARGMTGEVKVQFTIDATGKPLSPKLLASSGNPRLDDIVLGAIEKMEFPAPPSQMSLAQRTFNVPFAYRIAR